MQDDGLDNAIERGLRSGAAIGGSDPAWLSMGWLKLFADGTLGSRTAALLEPIEGGGGTGIFTTPPEALASLAARAAEAGITTQIHAIGDAAVRAALDALAPTSGAAKFMPRLEHIQLCHPDDRRRFGKHGVAAALPGGGGGGDAVLAEERRVVRIGSMCSSRGMISRRRRREGVPGRDRAWIWVVIPHSSNASASGGVVKIQFTLDGSRSAAVRGTSAAVGESLSQAGRGRRR